MDKNILRKFSLNKATKTALIIVYLALILSFLYLIVPPILQSNHKDIVIGDNLPVTNPKNITLVVDLTELEGGNVSATLSTILLPANSQATKNSLCIKSVHFYPSVFTNQKDRSYLYDFEPPPFDPSQERPELDTTLQQPFYAIPSVRVQLPGDFVFSTAICAGKYARSVEYYEIKNNYLPELVEPSTDYLTHLNFERQEVSQV